jgi:hypothetical protein
MKIYVVTQGEYSDYHIITATTDKSVAEAVAKKFNSDSYCKPIIETYNDAETMLKPCWYVWFEPSGSVSQVWNESDNYYAYGDIGTCDTPRLCYDKMRVTVSADTEEAAIKIAAEIRAKYLAQKEGL